MAMAQYGDTSAGGGGSATPVPSAPTLPPGIGNAAQANQASQFMRAQPWYQDFLKQNGQNPNNVHLTKDQAYQLLQLARQKGIGISTKYSLDSSGNIVSDGMPGWEKAAIVAGIVVAGIYLAPVVVSALGGAAPASATATAAAAGDATAASTLVSAGVEASAVSGLGAAALPGAGTALVAPAAATTAGVAAPALTAAATVPTAAGTVTGGASGASAGVSGAGGGTSVFAPATSVSSNLTGDILRYGVPTAGNIIGGLIQANATSNASEAQQKYLQEALDYEKQRDAAAIALEGSRYADYSGNVAPYIARGNASGTRMSSLLGLPATPTSTAPTVSYGPSATSTGTGQPTAPVTTGPPMPRATSQLVTMQAPDGSTKQVPQEQVQHYQSLGALVVQ